MTTETLSETSEIYHTLRGPTAQVNPTSAFISYFFHKIVLNIDKNLIYRVCINYRRILQNRIFTNTEPKHIVLLPFERGMFAVS